MKSLTSARFAPPRPQRPIGIITRSDRALSPAAEICIELMLSEANAARIHTRRE